MSWFYLIVEFALGCIFLIWGANRFVAACVSLAKHFGVSVLTIGVLLVGFGTSFPELVVSTLASLKGNAGIAIGNVIGSNIANIGLCLGAAAFITPIAIHSKLIWREFPILLVVTFVLGVLFLSNTLTRLDGIILLVLLSIYLFWMFKVAREKNTERDRLIKEVSKEMPAEMSLWKSWTWWIIGLIILFVASEIIVSSASEMARGLNISEYVIGLTIVAIGTSLPELAASIASALRNEPEMAIGNVIGSNLFNSLAVLAMPALISPGPLPASLMSSDYLVMVAFTVVLWLFALISTRKRSIGRVEGGLLLLGFIAYLVCVIVIG